MAYWKKTKKMNPLNKNKLQLKQNFLALFSKNNLQSDGYKLKLKLNMKSCFFFNFSILTQHVFFICLVSSKVVLVGLTKQQIAKVK